MATRLRIGEFAYDSRCPATCGQVVHVSRYYVFLRTRDGQRIRVLHEFATSRRMETWRRNFSRGDP